MAPIRPTTEIKRRKTPLAVIPPTIGRLVNIPDTLPEISNRELGYQPNVSQTHFGQPPLS